MSETREHAVRHGAVAVIYREPKFLVIRRAQYVEAAGTYCFPGGAIVAGESAQETVAREMREELGVITVPIRQLWSSMTNWYVQLSWWLTELELGCSLKPNPAEVDEVLWLTSKQMQQLPSLLISNWRFLQAWQRKEFDL